MCEIHFYGERGLVNALFLDLRACDAVLDFLRKIEFAFREQLHLDLSDNTKVLIIVEAAFAEFGWPDAIIVATTPEGERFVIFLEAKVGLYRDEAADYTKREKGFNSTINGQFTLRYRLSRALREFGKHPSRLIEPECFATAYNEQTPRRLSKQENIEQIVRPHLVGASSYFFVALTDDAANIWRDLDNENSALLPFLVDPEGHSVTNGMHLPWAPECNAWPAYRANFGWIGFRDVEAFLCGGHFFPYAQRFLAANRRSSLNFAGERSFTNLRTKSWREYEGQATQRLRVRLRSIITESSPVLDGYLQYREEEGSDSVIDIHNQRVIKIITPVRPHDAFDILLGVSGDAAGLPKALRAMSCGVSGINNRRFEIIGISEGVLEDDVLEELVRDTLSNITDVGR